MASASIDISCTIQDTKSVDLGPYSGSPKITSSVQLTSTDITKCFTDGRAGSGADILNVSDGSLSSAYGVALTYVTVKAVIIQNTSNSAYLTVGGGTHPLFGSDVYTVKAGQNLVLPNVPATIDSTHQQITVTPSAAATYNVVILGA